ncbi:group II intron reverse transcriptase/maturase [Desulforhopalus sp. 52FAK]
MKRVVSHMTKTGIASGKQLRLPFRTKGDEIRFMNMKEGAPVKHVIAEPLLERVLERGNMFTALQQVMENKGCGGVDGLNVDELPAYLKEHWPRLRVELRTGSYKPQPVKRVTIAKPGGGERHLGIPTVVDRLIQQALLQVLQREWDPTFSDSSYGFRPERNAHQAVRAARGFIRCGHKWVVDMDLEKFFDRVNHDVLMHRVQQRVDDPVVVVLIYRYLKAGVLSHAGYQDSDEGTPQGGPLSPLLSNLLLDDLDKELERRGHKFARYADDCNIYVKSRRAGNRVMRSVSHFLSRRLKLNVNEEKSAVDRPWRRKFLGFTFRTHKDVRIRVSPESERALKQKVRVITKRTRGLSFDTIVEELSKYLRGWVGYYQLNEIKRPFTELDKWIRRRLRCYAWKQWGRSGYRRLRELGISVRLAWNTSKSAHGPWRLSHSPALNYAMPKTYFVERGLPSLTDW